MYIPNLSPSNTIIVNLTSYPSTQNLLITLPDGRKFVHLAKVPTEVPAMTVEDMRLLAKQYIDHRIIKDHLANSTVTSYNRAINEFARWQVNQDATPDDTDTWMAYYAWRKERYRPSTVRNRFHPLHQFAQWLVTQGRLTHDPYANVTPPQDPKEQLPKAISREHIQLVLAEAANGKRELALILFMRDTGMRASEVVFLTWNKLNLHENTCEVLGKGNKIRNLPISHITSNALRMYRKTLTDSQNRKWSRVWWGAKGALTYNGLYKILKRLGRAAGLDDDALTNPHAFRHAYGRDMILAGVRTGVLQDLMGHSQINTTEIYTQFDMSELQQVHMQASLIAHDLGALPDKNGNIAALLAE